MSNKNAYEIRLEVLQMAHDDVFHTYYEKLNVLRAEDEKDPSKKMLTETEIDVHFPKTNVILERAEELYTFVSSMPSINS
jgi:hypothetical protein